MAVPEAADVLLEALVDETSPAAQHVAKSAIEEAGSSMVPGLLARLANGTDPEQRYAAEMLGWIADPTTAENLAAALHSENAATRSQVAWALGEIGNSVAQQALVSAAANDPSPNVRLQATQALAHLPEQPRVSFVSAPPASSSTKAPSSSEAATQGDGLQAPDWLHTILPVLRWMIVAVVLALAALLPWYQTARGTRRRRQN